MTVNLVNSFVVLTVDVALQVCMKSCFRNGNKFLFYPTQRLLTQNFVYPTSFSSVPAPAISNDQSLILACIKCYIPPTLLVCVAGYEFENIIWGSPACFLTFEVWHFWVDSYNYMLRLTQLKVYSIFQYVVIFSLSFSILIVHVQMNAESNGIAFTIQRFNETFNTGVSRRVGRECN